MKQKIIVLFFVLFVLSSVAALAIQNNDNDAQKMDAPPIPMPELECDENNPSYHIPATEYSCFYDERIPLDETTQAEVCYAAQLAEIDPYLAFAVIWQETNFQNVIGDGGDSLGYMQVQPKWHEDRMERLGCDDLMMPYENFIVGCDFLGELLASHSLENALTYYNAGYYGCNGYALRVIDKYSILINGGDVR